MPLTIYIASSWRHRHGVEMLTALLRASGNRIISWIENCDKEGAGAFQFEEWIKSPEADECFQFDVQGAMTSDLVIYYGSAGKDACAELGAAYARGRIIFGLYSKNEDLGLMRKMVTRWFDNFIDLASAVDEIQNSSCAQWLS